VPALQQAIDLVFDARVGDISGRGKLAADMREIWMMQPRFERRTGSGPHRLIEQPRYRAGFDFLALRAEAGEIDPALADWWEDFALGSEDDRRALLDQARETQRQGGPRSKPKAGGGRVHSLPRGAVSGESAAALPLAPDHAEVDGGEGGEGGEGGAPNPARKRRRRRKPKGAGGGESSGAPAGAASGDE